LIKKCREELLNFTLLIDVLREKRFNVLLRFINYSPEIVEMGRIFARQISDDEDFESDFIEILESENKNSFPDSFAIFVIPLMAHESFRTKDESNIFEDRFCLLDTYFQSFDDSKVNFFDGLVKAYGVEFIKEFLEKTSLFAYCHETNIPKILKWINENTSESDYDFVRNVLLMKNNKEEISIERFIKRHTFEYEHPTVSIGQVFEALKFLSSKNPKQNLIKDVAMCMDMTRSDSCWFKNDFSGIIKRFKQILENVKIHMPVDFIRPMINLNFLKSLLSDNPSFQETSSFIEIIKDVFDNFDEFSLKNLQILAMKKLLKEIPDKTVSPLFGKIKISDIVLKNNLLFEFKILKKDENNEVTFCDIDAGVDVFGSSYLFQNCREIEVLDLIIEMVVDEKEYTTLKKDSESVEKKILHSIIEDSEIQKKIGIRLTEKSNVKLLKRIFLKDNEEKYDLLIKLIFSALRFGDCKCIKEILQATNNKDETCLHLIAKYSEKSLISFLEFVEDENLVDNFRDWLLKRNIEKETFISFITDSREIKEFLRSEFDENLIKTFFPESVNSVKTN
jgi:hypothetical protein